MDLEGIVAVYSPSHVQRSVTPWTVARQSLLSIGFPSKNTGVTSRSLFQGIFLTQVSNRCLLHWQVDSLTMGTIKYP